MTYAFDFGDIGNNAGLLAHGMGITLGLTAASTALGGLVGTAGALAAVARVAGPAVAFASTTVPHAWHSPQRPTHLTAVQPHSVQR